MSTPAYQGVYGLRTENRIRRIGRNTAGDFACPHKKVETTMQYFRWLGLLIVALLVVGSVVAQSGTPWVAFVNESGQLVVVDPSGIVKGPKSPDGACSAKLLG